MASLIGMPPAASPTSSSGHSVTQVGLRTWNQFLHASMPGLAGHRGAPDGTPGRADHRRVMQYGPAERGCPVPGGPCHPWLVSFEADQPLLHPLLAGRWSPTTFDASYELAASEIEALLEAARWAPSAGNSQPWAFIVGQRGDAAHGRLVRHLAGSSARWAPAASVLMANLAHRYVEDTDWEYSEFSLYDLGQAVAHLTL